TGGSAGRGGGSAGSGGRGGTGGSSAGSGGRGGSGVAGSGGGGGGAAGSGGRGGGAAGGTGGALPAVTVWIAGDSTVASNGGTPCPIGWGGPFPMTFGPGVTVKNSAVGGRSVRTWLYNVQTTM